jgi:hypothetical protein
MKYTWPFPDAPNTVVFTTRGVIEKGNPILLVTHEQDDGAWQFRMAKTVSAKEGRIVALDEIVFNDPSLMELADLPRGWIAVRDSSTAKWKRRPIMSMTATLRRRNHRHQERQR